MDLANSPPHFDPRYAPQPIGQHPSHHGHHYAPFPQHQPPQQYEYAPYPQQPQSHLQQPPPHQQAHGMPPPPQPAPGYPSMEGPAVSGYPGPSSAPAYHSFLPHSGYHPQQQFQPQSSDPDAGRPDLFPNGMVTNSLQPSYVEANGGPHQHNGYANGQHQYPTAPTDPGQLSVQPLPHATMEQHPMNGSGEQPGVPLNGMSGGVGPTIRLDYSQLSARFEDLLRILQPITGASEATSTFEEAAKIPPQIPRDLFGTVISGLRVMDHNTAERIAKDSPLTLPPEKFQVKRGESFSVPEEDGEGDDDDEEDGSAPKKQKRDEKPTTDPQSCLTCGAKSSPEWRRGPLGPRTLCNACGLVYIKMMKRRANGLPDEDSPAGEDDGHDEGYTTGGSH